jgi:hypothetical protein
MFVDCKGSPTAPAARTVCTMKAPSLPPSPVGAVRARLQNETLMLLLHFIIRLVIALACFATQFSERRVPAIFPAAPRYVCRI